MYTSSIEDCAAYVLKNDVLENMANNQGSITLKDIKRKIIIVPENLGIDRLFEKILIEKEHIAQLLTNMVDLKGLSPWRTSLKPFLG